MTGASGIGTSAHGVARGLAIGRGGPPTGRAAAPNAPRGAASRIWRTLLAVGLLPFAACSASRQAEVRYRISIVVDDHGERRVGAGVWRFALGKAAVPLASRYGAGFAGEAIPVALSGGRHLFALLRGSDGDEGTPMMLPERFFGDIGRDHARQPRRFVNDRVADLRDIGGRVGERRTLPCRDDPQWCPMLVTFDDLRDRETVRLVDPGDLAAVFGAGVRLERIVVEITRDEPTRGIVAILPWLQDVRGALVQPPSGVAYKDQRLAHRLHRGDFRQDR